MKRINQAYPGVRIVRSFDLKSKRTTMIITIEDSDNDIFEDLNKIEDAILSAKILEVREEPLDDNVINLGDYR